MKNQAVNSLLIKANTSFCKVLLVFFLFISNSFFVSGQTVVSIQELVTAAAKSNQTITMKPGTYKMQDYLTSTVIDNIIPDLAGRWAMITFSGSNNTFDFTGVTIEVNTALLNDRSSKFIEFYVTGSNVKIKGLTVTDIDNYASTKGGQSFTVDGENNTIENVTLNINGSSPYGYGDLLGKGDEDLVTMKKHSGMLIEGKDITIKGCTIISRAFGHLFFIQGGRNVLFEDCYAEAFTRTTDEMLAETSGTAFNLNFASIYVNYEGNKVITPGYTKSLSECGFRTYGSGGVNGQITGALTFINCTAKNTRIGFALTRVDGDIKVSNCEAIGCEAGYNLEDVIVEKSSGDAAIGPLLYLAGTASTVELDLLPTVGSTIVNTIANIAGTNHIVTIKASEGVIRQQSQNIYVGAGRPAATNSFSPFGSENATGVQLYNCSGMPVELMSTAKSCSINSNSTITNNGTSNTVKTASAAECYITNVCNNTTAKTEAECYDSMSGIQTEEASEGTLNVGWINNGDWMSYNNLDLTGMKSVIARISGKTTGSTIEVRLGSTTGTVLATIPVTNTGGNQTWKTDTVNLNTVVTGTQNVYLVFKGGSGYLYNLNWFGFSSQSETTLSVNSLETEEILALYPNPVTNKLNIKWSGFNTTQISIINSVGQMLISEQANNGAKSIDVSRLPAGIYLVKLVNKEQVLTKKFIKQ